MTVYYARSMAIYDTPEEKRDMDLLASLGWMVVPFTPEMQARAKEEGMVPFEEAVRTATMLIFRALPNGEIGAGVAQEIKTAQEAGIPVLEFPQLKPSRMLSVEETRWHLHAAGQR